MELLFLLVRAWIKSKKPDCQKPVGWDQLAQVALEVAAPIHEIMRQKNPKWRHLWPKLSKWLAVWNLVSADRFRFFVSFLLEKTCNEMATRIWQKFLKKTLLTILEIYFIITPLFDTVFKKTYYYYTITIHTALKNL